MGRNGGSGSDGKEAVQRRKGRCGSDGREVVGERKGGGSGSLRSLLCRLGDSFSVARHWVRPSVASLALLGVTGGSDPLSHRSPERSSGRRRVATGGGRGQTRCATEFTRLATAGLTPCSDGKVAQGRKGSVVATERKLRRGGRAAAVGRKGRSAATERAAGRKGGG